MNLLEIDGNYGEGGGQILRSSLSLSAILGRPIRIANIRSGRKRPGLAAQHLTCVNAVAAITNAEVTGGSLGSQTLTFIPKELRGGNYTFDVAEVRPSAGSLSLIYQAIALPLAHADVPSTVTLRGGTHVPWSPNVHYLQEVFIPMASQFGFQGSLKLNKWGWYPKGGGEAIARFQPVSSWQGIDLRQRGELKEIRGVSAISNLPNHIAVRQRNQSLKRLKPLTSSAHIDLVEGESIGMGTLVFLSTIFGNARGGFFALGKRGKRAEQVADEACEECSEFLASEAAIEPHLANQLILLMALAKGKSSLTTSRITRHLTTNIWLVQQFLPVQFEIDGGEGEMGSVVKQKA